MRQFSVGDRVIALTNPEDDCCQPRVKGGVYNVEAIQYCQKCGKQAINIGEIASHDEFVHPEHVECECGGVTIDDGRLFYTDSELFVKVEDLEIELNEAVHNENYELASILRDVK